MTPLPAKIGQASGAGKPVKRRAGESARAGVRTVSQPEKSLSSSLLTIRFQLAWRPAEHRTRVSGSIHMVADSES
ncbi:MAG: hypothetical protein A2Z31_03580 [candidate division NC10 bacterium RBG_16_65_8]|nr:MAG: hypothetical protein A2Z31_03580 [candidate division NC10 bacterium RBG_16_65_8]